MQPMLGTCTVRISLLSFRCGKKTSPHSVIVLRTVFIIGFLVGTLPLVLAQGKTVEPAILECRYLERVVVDTLSGRRVSDTLILKAGRTASAFYSKDLLFADSLKAQPDGQQEFRRLMLLYAKEGRISELTSNTSEYIYQNWPDGCITTRAKLGKEPVGFTEERELPKWTLRDSVKTILGYECRMAEADFRGRKWVAWYSVEVPLSVGPWKLWGLPGLIFEAYDSRMEYSYSMVSISADSSGNVTVFDWSDGKKKYTKVTRQKYLRAYSGQDFVNASKAKEAGLGNMASERKYDLREKDY